MTIYKKQNIALWNEIAPRYHKRWAGVPRGPFEGTTKLVERVKISQGDRVLDVACGTGAVTRHLSSTVGSSGYVVAVDTSIIAIKIAKQLNDAMNTLFVNADAENLAFGTKFDAITCQYALFFFPDAAKALRKMRLNLKQGGRLGITVHGHIDKVPFYGSILNVINEFIPDYTTPNTPALDRYSTRQALSREVKTAGFSGIVVKDYTFMYSPGTFEQYWRDYLRYAAKPIKAKLDSLTRTKRSRLKELVSQNVQPYVSDGIITFPWQVLILTAKH